MKYKIVNIKTSAGANPDVSILIIYTGGTLGMVYNESGSLVPFNFSKIRDIIPSLQQYDLRLTVISFPEPIDSSNVNPANWADLGYIIHENYAQYDGFVVLHGTDTMAYSASALSFMLQGLNKPVIFTGSQLPMGVMRSDARENLFTAIELAAARENGRPLVPEVCIFFDSYLLRGNRSKKLRSSHFSAFASENYPALAVAGILIDYNQSAIMPYEEGEKLTLKKKFDPNVAIMTIFPGMTELLVRQVLSTPGLRGVVMVTYGSGNAFTSKWFLDCIQEAIDRGVIFLNVSQCAGGRVLQGRYATSEQLEKIGVVGGSDLTLEAALTKLMFTLGNHEDAEEIKSLLRAPIAGEMT